MPYSRPVYCFVHTLCYTTLLQFIFPIQPLQPYTTRVKITKSYGLVQTWCPGSATLGTGTNVNVAITWKTIFAVTREARLDILILVYSALRRTHKPHKYEIYKYILIKPDRDSHPPALRERSARHRIETGRFAPLGTRLWVNFPADLRICLATLRKYIRKFWFWNFCCLVAISKTPLTFIVRFLN